jgi:hypothetical protein
VAGQQFTETVQVLPAHMRLYVRLSDIGDGRKL